MTRRPLTPAEVKRALAAIDVGHRLESAQLSAIDLDRARRILTGDLSPEDARADMREAIERVVDDERRHAIGDGQHAITEATHIRALARRLTDALGPTIVSTLAGSTDSHAATAWGTPYGPLPDDAAATRLERAYDAWRNVSAAEGDDVARAWFVGGNPWLRDDSPITAIRDGRFDEVAAAAKACMADSFSG